ncbi:hypothetical protein NLJ89_g1180 [Agrocybe chaxingu]|uniref:Uncharacterized protein n=1 Tax=Agrocybe chaxingu TaxID=84603 RepID=A0A9W8TFM2_9AGAR|nr:hypothetical protein NLJ89_g1180 [Agrocybe chaxingu]
MNAYENNYAEILSSIAAVIDGKLCNWEVLQKNVECASQHPPDTARDCPPSKANVLAAIANILPRCAEERLALTAQLNAGSVEFIITSSDDACNPSEVEAYLSRVWEILKEIARGNRKANAYFNSRKKKLEQLGDTESKVVDPENDENALAIAKGEFALRCNLGAQVYRRCEDRLKHTIDRRWDQFQKCLFFLKQKCPDMEVKGQAIAQKFITNLEDKLSAMKVILAGSVNQQDSTRRPGLYQLLTQVSLLQKESDFKRLIVPLARQYWTDKKDFDLVLYLHKVGRINSSINWACEAPRNGFFSRIFELGFTIIVTPPAYQTPTALPTTGAQWNDILVDFASRRKIQFLDIDKIISHLLDAILRITQQIIEAREDLYLATSHQPCFACACYVWVLNDEINKFGIPPIELQANLNRCVFPWKLSQGRYEERSWMKEKFADELGRRLVDQWVQYGVVRRGQPLARS